MKKLLVSKIFVFLLALTFLFGNMPMTQFSYANQKDKIILLAAAAGGGGGSSRSASGGGGFASGGGSSSAAGGGGGSDYKPNRSIPRAAGGGGGYVAPSANSAGGGGGGIEDRDVNDSLHFWKPSTGSAGSGGGDGTEDDFDDIDYEDEDIDIEESRKLNRKVYSSPILGANANVNFNTNMNINNNNTSSIYSNNVNNNFSASTGEGITKQGSMYVSDKAIEFDNSAKQKKWQYNNATASWQLSDSDNSGEVLKNKLYKDKTNNNIYCFDENGNMVKGWFKNNEGKIYYFNEEKGNDEGKLMSGPVVINGFYYMFGADGSLIQ